MNILLTPARIGPGRDSQSDRHAADDHADGGRRRLRHRRHSRLLSRACSGLASASSPWRWPRRKRPAATAAMRWHLRRSLPARAHPPWFDLIHRAGFEGLDPARPWRRAIPASTSAARRRSRLRRFRNPVYETTFETIVPDEMTKARIDQDHRRARRGSDPRAEGRLRLRRSPCRAWLPDLAIPRAVREPPHRRVRRKSREPRALRARRTARGQGGDPRHARRLSALGRGLFPRRLPYNEGRQIAIWAAQAGADALHVTAGHYRSLPSAQIVLPPMSMPDATFLHFAAGVKKAVQIPVIAVGRLGDPATATEAVRERNS